MYSSYVASPERCAEDGASRLLCAASSISPWRLRDLEVHCSANRIKNGVITLKEAQNESQIVAIPRRVLSGSDVSDAARCCARSAINRAQGKKCRAGARSFCRWLELVGSDSAVSSCGGPPDLRAKPPHAAPP